MKNFLLLIAACLGFRAAATAQTAPPVHTAKGATVTIFTHNPGDKIKLNDVVTFDVVQKTGKDSVLFSTYNAGHPVKVQVQPAQNVGDLMEVLPMLALKDSASVQIPSDSIFMGHEDQRPPFLPKGSNLVYVIKVERIQSLNDAIAERNKMIDSVKAAEVTGANKYIADNKLVLKTTPSGLKYVITQPSIKRKPLSGDTVLVNYTGRTVNGKVFDSSIQEVAQQAGLQQPGRTYEPIKVVVGVDNVIKGWTEGLLLLPEGSKAKLIIPSGLGYGDQGQGDDIPPYSTLIFDIEVVKIHPIKHAAAPAAKKPLAKKHPVAKKKS